MTPVALGGGGGGGGWGEGTAPGNTDSLTCGTFGVNDFVLHGQTST